MLIPLARSTALLAAGLLAAAAHAQAPAPPAACAAARCTTATEPKLVLVPYQVAELVVPVGTKTVGSDKKGEPAKSMATREDDLIKMIQDTVAPKSWASHGGRGTIDYFPRSMSLVINQTPEIQEQVADMLAALRRLQDTQVVLEVRVVSVPDQFFERIGVDFNVNTAKVPQPCPAQGSSAQPQSVGPFWDVTPGKCPSALTPVASFPCTPAAPSCESNPGPVFLTEKQVKTFLEAAQGDLRTNVMQAPKMTLFNGQAVHVNCIDKQKFVTGVERSQHDGQPVVIPKTEEVETGTRISACPKVSADRRSVLLDLDVNLTDVAAPVPLFPVVSQVTDNNGKTVAFTQFIQQPKVNTIRIDKKLTIPEGRTALLGGVKRVVEGRCEFGPPVLSKVPYVNRLFKNVGVTRETETVYVLVTPRVIVNEEEEQRQTAVTREDAPCCIRPVGVCAEECAAVAAPSHGQAKVIAELLKAYDEACAAGHKEEAGKLAQAVLILDPTCFAKSHGK